MSAIRGETPQDRAGDLLRIYDSGELTSPGRWKNWCQRAKLLPKGLKNWLLKKLQERGIDAEYVRGFIFSRQKGGPES